jgi:ATP-dependent helicase/DNAse subunit B
MGAVASGKTTTALNRVRAELSKGDLVRIWVVLPDRHQSQAFRTTLTQSGGMLGVSIGLFHDLCNEIMIGSGNYNPQAPGALIHRVVLEIVNTHSIQNKLGEFEAIKDKPGFIQLLHQKFKELGQAGFEERSSLDVGFEIDPQLMVLLDLYQSYRQRLKKMQWMDPSWLIRDAVLALQSNLSLIKGINLIIVDGFDRFTPPQRQLISLLAYAGIEVLVTLPGDENPDGEVYQRAQDSFKLLQQDYPHLEKLHETNQSFLPPSILGLSNNFLVKKPQKIIKQQDLRLLSTHSPLQEVREVLRWMKSFVVRGENLSDCAILLPDEVQYPPLLRVVAHEYGLPLHFSWGQPLINKPQIDLILKLLRLHMDDFPRRAFLDVLRSPYLNLKNLGFEPTDAARMERVSRYGPVAAGYENWQRVLSRMSEKGENHKQQSDGDDEGDMYALPGVEESLRLLQSLETLAKHLQPPESPQRISDWIGWFWQLLQNLGWIKQSISEDDEPWFQKMKQELRSLHLTELELGEWNLDYKKFVAELEMMFQLSTFEEKMDGNNIQVLRLVEARGSRFEHVAILGLAEGVFPKLQREDPFLPEAFRALVGLDSRLEQDQAGVFFQGITRANASLLVTRPYMSEKGEGLEPSPYWNAMVASLEESDIDYVRSTTKRDLEDAASLEELFFWTQLFRISVRLEDEVLIQKFDELAHQQMVFLARQQRTIEGVFEGELFGLPAALDRFKANDTDWSASRLETYKSCPMRFWTQYALVVEEQRVPELGLQASQVGSILHQILEEVYKQADDPSNVEQLLRLLPDVADRIFVAAPGLYKFEPTAYWQTQQQEWLLLLEAAITELGVVGWKPIAFEQKFGLDGNPALEIWLDEDRIIRLHGVIDRVDQDDQGNLRVIDYKTGVSHLSKEDLIRGTRLQLPLYALAAMQVFKETDVVEGFYWAINAKKPGSLKLSKFEYEGFEGTEGAIQVARQHLQLIMDGLGNADFRPQVPVGGCPDYCPARLWCWRYKAGR